MFQNVLGSDGRMHLERQFGNQRINLTTGEVKTVIPGFGGMNTVIDQNGIHTEMQIGNMRQALGKNGFDWMLQDVDSSVHGQFGIIMNWGQNDPT